MDFSDKLPSQYGYTSTTPPIHLGNSSPFFHKWDTGIPPSAVLETAGVPLTGGPPMLMSNALYFS